MEAGKIAAAAAVKEGGVAALVTTMSLGNELGFEFIKPFHDTDSSSLCSQAAWSSSWQPA